MRLYNGYNGAKLTKAQYLVYLDECEVEWSKVIRPKNRSTKAKQ